MKKIYIEKELKNKLKFIQLGIIQTNVICAVTMDELNKIIHESINEIKRKYTLDNVRLNSNINATRKAYRKIGNDPNRYRPSADALLRRIVKDQRLYSINNVVDVLNLVSIRSGYSISGFDTKKIDGDIYLGVGKVGEPYKGVGRGEMNISNLPVLRDNIGAFGTPTSDSERTIITFKTSEVLFVFYDFNNDNNCQQTIDYCNELLVSNCQAENIKQVIIT